MEVLLLKDVKGVGRRMEVKNVSDGYAKNALFPQRLAVLFDANARNLKSKEEDKQKSIISTAEAQVKRLKGITIEIFMKAGPQGHIFGSVKEEEIKKAIREKGFHDFDIELEKPIREIGEASVLVDFGRGIKGGVKVNVQPKK